jgi:hypothetical protein
MIAQFQGEDRKQAIVNHFSLDIEEEDLFFNYVRKMGYSIHAADEIIENLYSMWYKKQSEENH